MNNNDNSNNNNQNGLNNNPTTINNVARVIPVTTNNEQAQVQTPPSEDNIVAPTKVDLSKVQVNNDDTMINRERDNIVSATIQANEAIDKDKAKDVNNQIKIKKFSKLQLTLLVVVVLIVAIILATLVVSGANKIMTFDEKTTTTTTTQSIFERELAYLNRTSTIRKYQNEEYILLLSPTGIDLKDNNAYYMYLNYSENGVITEEIGTYTINQGKVVLSSNMNTTKEFELKEEGLVSNTLTLAKFDSEMKYYKYRNDTTSKILIINGTLKNERALWIQSTQAGTTIEIGTAVETDTNITVGNNTFTKKEMNIINNNEEYILVS